MIGLKQVKSTDKDIQGYVGIPGQPPVYGNIVKYWSGKVNSNSSGIAIFNVTSDGTGAGNPLFNNLLGDKIVILPSVQLNTNNVGDIPIPSVKRIVDNKVVEVNVVKSNAALIGGQALKLNDTSAVIVHLLIMEIL